MFGKTLTAFCAALFSATLLSACGESIDKAAYEANDQNCTPDHIKSLPDSPDREGLMEKCMTRGSYQKSDAKTW
ncbi:entry exclusion lipoprotein TrbK [Pseudomonas cremoricolorata]|uniref:entry exclusion lipoprotein TrbK n=1 Tax=Pseudomonas cremoricolorata TaxID=157783 RepID=UPI00040A9A4C|nr:entry exclusion lipoprotein TrbK [Pseudomonas cremoricolorata]